MLTPRMKPTTTDRLPRGHAYVRVRNKGYSIHVDFPAVSDDVAERMIEAAMKVFREDAAAFREKSLANPTKDRI